MIVFCSSVFVDSLLLSDKGQMAMVSACPCEMRWWKTDVKLGTGVYEDIHLSIDRIRCFAIPNTIVTLEVYRKHFTHFELIVNHTKWTPISGAITLLIQ